MNSTLLAAYTVIALLVALYTICSMAMAGPHQRRDKDSLDRGILLLTALAASAAWGLLLPLFISGWASSTRGRQVRSAINPISRLRPDPIFRERLYKAIR